MMCHKCSKLTAWLFLLLGIALLLVDFGVWDFFGIMWWSAAITIWGLTCVSKAGCKDCQKMCK